MADTVIIGSYRIEFLGSTCFDGSQLWRYRVTLLVPDPGPGALSHWAIQLCENHAVDAAMATAPDPAFTIEVTNNEECLGDERAIKWEFPQGDFPATLVNGEYTFTITNGCYEEAQVPVAIKVGQPGGGCLPPQLITGPGCTLQERRTRGFRV